MIRELSKLFRKCQKYVWSTLAKRKVAEFGSSINVNKKSVFTRQTKLGSNVHFNGITIQGKGRVTIGDNFHSGENILFITQIHNYHGDKIPYDSTYIMKDIAIEENVWLGTNVTILGGVTIGEGAIIQAGSVVVNDIAPLSIAGGHPAKIFSQRDSKHYNTKKELGLFH